MKILCIDTSTSNLSIVLGEDDSVIRFRNYASNRRLSETMYDKLESFLKLNQLRWKDIDGFIVGLGPGAFTSMRVGIASVQGLGYALKKPVVGVCSLDALAAEAGDHSSICVINDARRDLLYAGYYTTDSIKTELVAIDQVLKKIKKKTVFIGSGVALYRDKLENFKYTEKLIEKETVEAKYLLPMGYKQLKGKTKNKITPIYLYPEDCQVRR